MWIHIPHVNSYIDWIHTFHVNSYIVWIHTYHMNSYIVWIHTYHVNSYIVWIHALLAWFPISGCNHLSLPLEQRRWQKHYQSCRAMVMLVVIVLKVQTPAFGHCIGIMLFDMIGFVAPAARAKARTRTRVRARVRRRLRSTPFPDKLPALDKEEWSLCMASSLFFLKRLRLQSSSLL